jgi:hypothetical protein
MLTCCLGFCPVYIIKDLSQVPIFSTISRANQLNFSFLVCFLTTGLKILSLSLSDPGSVLGGHVRLFNSKYMRPTEEAVALAR